MARKTYKKTLETRKKLASMRSKHKLKGIRKAKKMLNRY